MSQRDQDMMVQVALMYYEDNLTHEQIAKKMHVSRPTVSRLLQQARETGVVQIKVVRPAPRQFDISRQLEETFGLDNTVVFSTPNDHSMMLQEVAWAIVDYFRNNVHDGETIGFGWATSFAYVPNYLRWLDPLPNSRVVHLMGHFVGPNRPFGEAAAIAEAIQAKFYPLFAPVLLNSSETRMGLLEEPSIRQSLEVAAQCDIAFVSVGSTLPVTTLVKYGAFTSEEMALFRRKGLVGDVLLHFYDIHGQHHRLEMNDRVIGIGWEELKHIPRVVVISQGEHKVEALLGILRSGICSALITDLDTGQAILQAHRQPVP